MEKQKVKRPLLVLGLLALLTLQTSLATASDLCLALGLGGANLRHGALTTALKSVAPNQAMNGGLGNHMWATLVDQDGKVCSVTFTGDSRGDQWGASRAISAQKANTATSLNLPAGVGGTVDAIATANLWSAVQPGGSLFGLQFSNPVDPAVAYGNAAHADGNADRYGTPRDPLVGNFIGGINVFGGGLALYNAEGKKVGAIGVSGDTSCADHNIAWRTRHALGLDHLTTAGVGGLTADPRQDNIIYDLNAMGQSASGFGHPTCGFGEDVIAPMLPPTQ